ncbi:MAG: hypothetical protein P4M14_04610 [Gammaproteobacteria bacterium]|nr:hypothetical protein [Gammaproteobacteria bacterium]
MSSSRSSSEGVIPQGIRELYTSRENLAHNIVYQSWLVDGHELNVDDNADLPYVVKQVNVAHAGLYCFILKPKPECRTKEVFILFRGTQCLDSLFRDIEPEGAGALSIARALPIIMEEVNNAIDDIYSRDIRITICGHSLGGADTQNCFVALMKEADTHQSNFHKVSLFTLVAFNAAGVTTQVANDSIIYATNLARKGKKIKCYWLHAAGDIVQQTGQATILADVGPDIAEVHLVKASSSENAELKSYLELFWIFNVISRTALAHTSHYFRADVKDKVKLEYYTNATPEGREIIRKKLSKKINFLQYFNFRISQQVIMQLRDYLYRVSLVDRERPNTQLIHLKREPTLQDLLMNATDISFAFDSHSLNGMPEIRFHMAPEYPAGERLDMALVPNYQAPSARVIAIALPLINEMILQQQRYLASHASALELPGRHVAGRNANFVRPQLQAEWDDLEERKNDLGGHQLDEEEKRVDVVIDIPAENPIQPKVEENSKLSKNMILIGALFGMVASLAIAIFVPPAIPLIAALLHVSTTMMGGIMVASVMTAAGSFVGSVLGAIASSLHLFANKKMNVQPKIENGLFDDNNEPAPQDGLGSTANLHRKHSIRIQVDAHGDAPEHDIQIIPGSLVEAKAEAPIIRNEQQPSFAPRLPQ